MGVPTIASLPMMERLGAIAVGIVLVTVALPGASAGSAPACEAVTDQPAVTAGTAYIQAREDRASVWQEANAVDGLQTSQCQTEDGTVHDADDRVPSLTSNDSRSISLSCQDAEDRVIESPAGVAYSPFPGTFCELANNWVGFAEDASGAEVSSDSISVPDLIATCNSVAGAVPATSLQCL